MNRQLTCALIPLAAASTLLAQDPFRKAPPQVENALRSRVTEYYTLYEQGKFRQTEAYIAEESRDAYYATSKNPIHSFEIKDINFAPDFQSAEVVVLCETTVAIQARGSTVPLPVHSRWKRVDGEWYALLGRGPGDAVETPFGKMKFNREAGGAGHSNALARPGPQSLIKSLGTMFKLSGSQVLKFPASSAEPSTQSITLSNTGPATLRLRAESPPVAGIEVVSEPQEIRTGETMQLSFTYQPEVARLTGKREFRFTILPLNQEFSITLSFEE